MFNNLKKHKLILFLIFSLLFLFLNYSAIAQSSLEGRINETIDNLVSIVNIIIIGFIAWSGFLIAKGDGTGITRLIYGVIGFIIVNAAGIIINYFS